MRIKVFFARPRFRSKIDNWNTILPTLASFFFFPLKNLRRLSKLDLQQIVSSEIFLHFSYRNRNYLPNRGYFRREWTRLAWMAMDGRWREANSMRVALLHKARVQYGLSEEFSPNIMERAWTSNYGHLGALIKYRDAQQLGLVAPGRRLIVRSRNYSENRPIYRLLRESFDFMDSTSPSSVFDLEPLFPLTEKVSFIRTNEGYHDLSEFFNLVGERQKQKGQFRRGKFKFSEAEQEFISQKFIELDIDLKQPFVALHIRDTKDKYAVRDSTPDNFIPAIRYITSRGIPLIRIGSQNASLLPQIPGFIDSRDSFSAEEQLLNDFVISNCEYFISSQSGPSVVAHALGVPTLIVDGVAILKHSFTTPGLSMTLPKPWLDSTERKLSAEEILEIGLGFKELATSDGGYHLRNNSPEEILFAVKEFLGLIEQPNQTRTSDSKFQHMKECAGGIGDGLISELFFLDKAK